MNLLIPKIIGFFLNALSMISARSSAKVAMTLFSTPRKGRPTEEASDFLNSAFKEEVSYNDISIMTYRWIGKNQTVLLAHGWESNSYRWKKLIEILKEQNYNIIALDAPAHGNSGSKTFNALLYSECINVVAKKFNADIIIGHSVGGMATVFFQHKHQLPSIKKLILLGAPSNFTGVFERYVTMMGYNKRIYKHMNQLILERFNHLPDYFSASDFSKEIATKGLIIHDKNDTIIPYDDAKNFEQHYSNAQLITTTGLGHGLRNDSINQNILEFIIS